MIRKQPKINTKGAVITFRLTPKSRFALELIARRQHRSVTSVVEWAIEQIIQIDGVGRLPGKPEFLRLDNGAKVDYDELQLSLLDKIWSPSESYRLVNFAKYAPELMSFEEKLIWEKITEEPIFLKTDGKLDMALIKAAWELLVDYGDGEIFDDDAFNDLLKERRKNLSLRTNKGLEDDTEEDTAPPKHKVKKMPVKGHPQAKK